MNDQQVIELPAPSLDEQLIALLEENAKPVDKNDIAARYILPELAKRNLLNRSELLETARTIRDISRYDLSAAFTTWAHRSTIEYLLTAQTDKAHALAENLIAGQRPGVTGMAGAFKAAAGAGEIDLQAEESSEGLVINGKLNWASNIYDDALIVSAAQTEHGDVFIFAVDAAAEGITLGKSFGLLGLNATRSSFVNFENVCVPADQILSRDFDGFIQQVRRSFIILQVSECLGLAEACLAAASTRLHGVNEVLTPDVQAAYADVQALIETQEEIAQRPTDKVQLLELRLAAARAATTAANLEVRVAGGAGYAQSSPASRRYREASFIPVQSPSETQLTWELQRAKAEAAV